MGNQEVKRDWFDPAYVAERKAEKAAKVAQEEKLQKRVEAVFAVFKKVVKFA